jgi:hypothetical protein
MHFIRWAFFLGPGPPQARTGESKIIASSTSSRIERRDLIGLFLIASIQSVAGKNQAERKNTEAQDDDYEGFAHRSED